MAFKIICLEVFILQVQKLCRKSNFHAEQNKSQKIKVLLCNKQKWAIGANMTIDQGGR